MRIADYDFHLFDLDGTLVDAEWEYTRTVFDRVGDRLDREFSDREARVLWHGLGGSRAETLRGMGVDPDAFWPAFHAVEDPVARAEATYLHDDAARLLDRVGEVGGPTGLVTHCQEFLAEPVLDRLDLGGRFDAVVCCTDETGWKPAPDPIEAATSELGVDPARHRGYYVGDGESDVAAAWNAGLDAVHVERVGHDERGRCILGDRRVRRLDELVGGEGRTDAGRSGDDPLGAGEPVDAS
ncbi:MULTISPECIES: HAD family hydrolase [unclassified Halorubrum]|uniref:HAD family hydrolase n=1 Tax=unclassified Halorubrum TaxID=2642239 RepID=UPI0010F5E784|nr:MULTISPECIES: HAD family hydrolase [unclassified Halorubrum]TKX45395.1 HAD family hydrolase [Halorubrum sp. ARQ200]TKX51432.1 HAD family hydrolase [Halorubrum sp. ASP121]